MINLTECEVRSLIKELRQRIKWKKELAPLNSHEERDLIIYRIALEALESRADAELAEIDERAAFNAWNNDTDCPLAGRDAKSAAWLAWNRRAAMLAAAPKQEAQEVKK